MIRRARPFTILPMFALAFILPLAPTGLAEIREVPREYPAIQQAIDAALDHDTVRVAPGTYNERIDFKGKAIRVVSTEGPARTVIDASALGTGSVVTFASGEGPDSVLEGFTITGGNGSDLTHQSLDNGGGIVIRFASPTVKNNRITGNIARNCGGGIALMGGAGARITGNLIENNRCGNLGGGIVITRSGRTVVAGNRIQDNEALGMGGGITTLQAETVLVNNIILRNRSAWDGGGVLSYGSIKPTVAVHNTIAFNECVHKGGGFASVNGDKAILYNSILFGNEAGRAKELLAAYSHAGKATEVTIRHCLVDGGKASVQTSFTTVLNWGPNMIDADPLFVGPDDPHLTAKSPCRNQGSAQAPEPPATDFEGDPKPPAGDLGADEFAGHIYLTGDPRPEGRVEVKLIGQAGVTGLIFAGPGLLENPLPTPYGDWRLAFPILSMVKILDMPKTGCTTLILDIPPRTPPSDFAFQGLLGQFTNACELKITSRNETVRPSSPPRWGRRRLPVARPTSVTVSGIACKMDRRKCPSSGPHATAARYSPEVSPCVPVLPGPSRSSSSSRSRSLFPRSISTPWPPRSTSPRPFPRSRAPSTRPFPAMS